MSAILHDNVIEGIAPEGHARHKKADVVAVAQDHLKM